MLRFSLRAFLLGSTVAGALLAALLGWRWQPWARSALFKGLTANNSAYDAYYMVAHQPFEKPSLLNVVILPLGVDYSWSQSNSFGDGPEGGNSVVEIMPRGVFVNDEVVGGVGLKRVLINQGAGRLKVVELTAEDLDALNACLPGRLDRSPVWTEKVEPEIEQTALKYRPWYRYTKDPPPYPPQYTSAKEQE